MSGFCLWASLAACIAVLAGVALWSLWHGRGRGRAVLMLAQTIPVRLTEGAVRSGLDSLLASYPIVAVYIGETAGERAEIVRRLCVAYNVEQLDRAAALKLWRGGGAEFWRLCRDGGMVRVRS